VPKDKESRQQLILFVDDATEAALSKEFVPKNTATSTKGAVSNFVVEEMGETLEIKSMEHSNLKTSALQIQFKHCGATKLQWGAA